MRPKHRLPSIPFLAAGLLFPLSGAFAQSIHEAAATEIRGLRSGLVLALCQDGEVSFLEAFGTTGPNSEEPLTPDHLFAFPALTEVLVGALVQAMDGVGFLDPETPISEYLPLLSPRLGSIRLSQLLSHTSGLDDAVLREGQEWSEALDQLSDRALFTDPGFIYSRSRYSFPLALRVLERATGSSFQEIVDQAILKPLEMTRSTFDPETAKELGLVTGIVPNNDESSPYRIVAPTAEVDGLPVLFTTAPDVLRFLVSWMAGGIQGDSPWAEIPSEDGARLPGDQGFRSGVQVEEYAGHMRVSRTGTGLGMGAGLYLFPAANTGLITFGIGSRPPRTTVLALERIAGALGPGTQTPEEQLDRAMTVLGLDRFQEARDSAGAPTPEYSFPSHDKGWAGIYLNGEYKVEIRSAGQGLVYFTGVDELPVSPGPGGSATAIREDGLVRVALRLEVDRAGRRYVRLGDKAFLHSGDGLH